MIRKRDFVLYVVVLGFVLLSSLYTGLAGRTVAATYQWVTRAPSDAAVVPAYAPQAAGDIATRREVLRERLAAGDGYLADSPAVFTSVDQTRAPQPTTTTATSSVTDRRVTWCGVPGVPSRVATWPRATTLRTVETQRVVETATVRAVTVGTTTTEMTTNETVVTLPIRSIRSTFDSCVPDQLIGITTNGQPLLNDQAASYHSYSPGQVVGYTRDGFAVHGPVADSSMLDACGGQYVGGVYQYHLRADESFILACFAGVPAAL